MAFKIYTTILLPNELFQFKKQCVFIWFPIDFLLLLNKKKKLLF